MLFCKNGKFLAQLSIKKVFIFSLSPYFGSLACFNILSQAVSTVIPHFLGFELD
jgi:hypothetical protein